MSGNSIYGNQGFEIDLGGDGVTTNDLGDPDVGPNTLQNYPFISSAISDGNSLTITGSLASAPFSSYLLQFFSVPEIGVSGEGEGKTFIGTFVPQQTDPLFGFVSFVVTNLLPVGVSNWVVVTASEVDGFFFKNTSEFSPPVQVTIADDNGDGIPNGYETANGLLSGIANPSTADTDSDGLTDYEEYILGSSATNPTTFNITGLSNDAYSVHLSYSFAPDDRIIRAFND
ncbi:MAG: hypothetical protein GKR87_07185 [Kiritimatiellae bacterium]|nr:hypothetical protein [Kiritimatiellia bacterium]